LGWNVVLDCPSTAPKDVDPVRRDTLRSRSVCDDRSLRDIPNSEPLFPFAPQEPAMLEHHIDIPTTDGTMNSFVVHPQAVGSHPVVLIYMDALGKREELHDMARRLASAGYCVVLPNLFYRRSRDYMLKERSEAAMAELFAHMGSLNAATTQCDTRAMLSFVDAFPQADATRIGAVGYCMSGPLLVWAAAAFPDRLRSIAVIHGANMATEALDSPHRVVEKIKCESYFACAETDPWAPPADITKLQWGLKASGAPHRIEWYPGTQHGFVFPQRVGMYQPAAAERHWERLFDLFGRTLEGVS
jgi:carboxymethylenebutenolidase